MATAMARAAARRRLRSRTSWPMTDGPTPRPNGVESAAPISEILLGFGDFARESLDEGRVGRRLGMCRHERVGDLVGLEQQILSVRGRGAVDGGPQLLLPTRGIAGRQPRHRQAAGLLRIFVRIAPCALFVRRYCLAIPARQKQRVAKV